MKHSTTISSIELLKLHLGKLGYASKDIVLDKSAYTQFKSPSGAVWLTSNSKINYPFQTSTARNISTHKHIAYELARKCGVIIPKTKVVNRTQADITKLSTMLKFAPLIVKPNDASLSNGLSRNVMNITQLQRALKLAYNYSDTVLIQQQVQGDEIRFTIINGKIVAALLRQTPRVVGDGQQTVAQLLAEENRDRASLKLPYIVYPQLKKPLIDPGAIDKKYVPAAGEVVELGLASMIRDGASVYNVVHDVHPSYLRTAEQLAAEMGRGFLVVDIMIKDFTKPQTSGNYCFIEFNMSPVLKLFYSCRDYNNYDIMSDLVPLIDKVLV